MKNRSIQYGFISAALAALAAGACQAPEGVEVSGQSLTQNDSIEVGHGIKRYLQRVCSRKCVEWEDAPRGGGQHCAKFEDDCGVPAVISIHGTEKERTDGWPFYASSFGEGIGEYHGCGATGAKNMLAYYGADADIRLVAENIENKHSMPDGSIAIAPDDVANGLRKMLGMWGDGSFTVTVHSGVNVRSMVRGSLNQGRPILVLVQGGNHWQMATKLEADTYTFIDYPWNNYFVNPESDLEFGITFPRWFVYGYHGYKSDTVITVVRN